MHVGALSGTSCWLPKTLKVAQWWLLLIDDGILLSVPSVLWTARSILLGGVFPFYRFLKESRGIYRKGGDMYGPGKTVAVLCT